MLDEYLCYFKVAQNIGNDQPSIGIEGLIDWLMKDAVSTATVRTFRELWAMAFTMKPLAAWLIVFTMKR
jgi:hypothetical protein